MRQKVRDLLSQEGKIETEPTPQDLKIILKKRQSNLGLSNTELDTLASKLDINTFASLDVAMERPVILTNLIPEIRTTNSYAGYEWEIRPIGGYNYLNLNFIAPDPLLPAQIAKKLAEINWENGTFRLSSMKGRHQNEYSLNFSLTGPSEEWMQKTGRSPYLDYVRRWNGRLEQLFGCAIAVPTKVDSVAGKENLDYEAYCRLLDYTYNDLINRKQLKTKYNTIKFPPMRVDEYYYDYYISEDAKHARDRFLEKLEEILQEYRKS